MADSKQRHRYFFDFFRLSLAAEFSRDMARNKLGVAWWLLEPALMLAVFYLVFGKILMRGGPDFIYDLLVGVALWTAFSNTVQRCTASVERASQLMQQVYVPKILLPLICVATEAIKLLILMGVLLGILAVTIGPSATWVWLPVILVLQTLFAGACGIITGLAVPFMNDIKYVVTLLLRLGMFMSGVFYRIDEAVPVEYRDYLMLNPLATLIAETRHILVAGTAPSGPWMLYTLAVSLILLAFGSLLITRLDRVYPRLLAK